MEASWVVPCDLGWSMEESAAWSDDSSSLQTSFPSHSHSEVQLQVVEYAGPATHGNCNPVQVFEKAAQVFCDDYLRSMEWKMHKFPPSLIGVRSWYTRPLTVAIGPYHHAVHPSVLEAEKVKHVAANNCISDCGISVQEMYDAVFSVSHVARSLYHQEAVARIGDDVFLPMMFFDACFLVQFMRIYKRAQHMDTALFTYFISNEDSICTDIMKLENQIPWVVVKTILSFMPAPSPLEKFVTAMKRRLKSKISVIEDIVLDPKYEPPHLLGLVRFYIVGNNNTNKHLRLPDGGDKDMSLSISVAELANVGVNLVPKEDAAGLVDMCLQDNKKWRMFGDLVVPPLSLTEANATWLINMAAFELCKTPDFVGDRIDDEDSAVCSYLHLFAMLLDQEQHVHELRENKVIEGGGLTSKEALEFFTCIGKNMRLGKCYLDIIIKIEKFKLKRSVLLKLYLFITRNRNKIITVLSVFAAVVGVLSSLQALKPAR
ncbi:uncharacterized protein LOC100837124 isoform X1 [Brachypodium distachyon]|nr:uncharacterized protein LOC100837124 isoform X1 [Brachypodium distachyon]XP_024319058.1 uncharacterized protein LOC100837124 isoform X1 [Brachypodium distachyon]XP_024319067.1 uncharacterized protein LOC100837124 isoform X1 [Brachypodium distachyon]XP_024319073.1 uncharacterized protein LOC100837124 isoform X1 [Brachypodium distachyon]XP_024319077.1 uncharacterized protein LOC100837124 isoform X1 [Brachypodium distachyon]XP_024319079.1 uncharacterized protein LOC100837124 isoform X1 [Brachy|eukprot:XP_010232562.1 uncharacterized protein LOC100837124 isoform X1 [Brachypodium distachyon]